MMLLNSLDHYGQSEYIEIAKGQNEYPKSLNTFFKQVKRNYKWLKRK